MTTTKTTLFFTLISLVCSLKGISQTELADQIKGVYWSPKKDAKITIYKKGDHYCGRFIWLASPRKDCRNPIANQCKNDVLGMEFLNGFSYSEGQYVNGTIYDPNSGNTYTCKMTLNGNKLKIRGYVGIALFGRTEIFEKINN